MNRQNATWESAKCSEGPLCLVRSQSWARCPSKVFWRLQTEPKWKMNGSCPCGGLVWGKKAHACSNESVSDFTAEEMSLHAQEDVGYRLPLQAPVLVPVAVEERSSNRVIDFFFSCSFVLFESGPACWLWTWSVRIGTFCKDTLYNASLMAWPSRICLCFQPWGH